MKVHSFNVQPNLPENMKFLKELSENMWFAWNWQVIDLFFSMEPKLWTKARRNPKWFLGSISQERLEELSKDNEFINKLNNVKASFESYKNASTWYKEHRNNVGDDFQVAYFSMEYGIGEGLPIYSGGLGMLAGDHIKSASDLGIPIIGVGLFYQRGYVKQQLNSEGWQNEIYPENDWANMPVEKIKNADGTDLTVSVKLANDELKIAVWKVPVGRTFLYLLDTNLPDNKTEYRGITEQLYGGDRENRIRQEVVLGIGGVKALKAMGMQPSVYHINEGHSAFLLIERMIEMVKVNNVPLKEAFELVWSTSVFTTHTPVIAGNEHFDPALVRKYMEYYAVQMGFSWDQFLQLGKDTPSAATFCMTVVALKLAAYLNGVSALHGRVSREMWRGIWPLLPVSEVPITSITNGIHSSSWCSHEFIELYKKYCFDGSFNESNLTDKNMWAKVANIPDNELWENHKIRKGKLVDIVRKRIISQLNRVGVDSTITGKVKNVLNPDVLTIGFARRFATYKRANLLFKDLDRLDKIVNNPQRPVQFVFAGKAHPADTEGKEYIKYIFNIQRDPRFRNKVIFVEDYNMNLARYMVQGVDVWLNNPIRPLEASGTSGMKSALNGALTLSVLDGWWAEVGPCDFSWSIGGIETYKTDAERDLVEAAAIYNTIEQEIAPLYYDRNAGGLPEKWIGCMKKSITAIAPVFNTHRMVEEYFERFYAPAYSKRVYLQADPNRLSHVANWRTRIYNNWNRVSIQDISERNIEEVVIGDTVKIKASVSLGALNPEEIQVQAYMTSGGLVGKSDTEEIVMLKNTGKNGDAYIYEADFKPCRSGRQDYILRVLPYYDNIPNVFTPFFISWEN